MIAGVPPKQKSKFKKGQKITDRLFTLLSVSTRLLFDNVRELKTLEQPGALSSFTPVERIQWARQYDVDRWLKPAYIDLCLRSMHLEAKDVEAIGLETVLLVAKARERYSYQKGSKDEQRSSRWLTPEAMDESQLQFAEDAVNDVFFPNTKPAVQLPEPSKSSAKML